MAVYVDDGRWPYRGMRMCHMWADTRDELLAMADRIGVARRHLQAPPRARWEHFDICQAKRAEAVRHGAIETDRYGPAEHKARLDIASLDPARVRMGHTVLRQVEASRARRMKGPEALPLFQENRHG